MLVYAPRVHFTVRLFSVCLPLSLTLSLSSFSRTRKKSDDDETSDVIPRPEFNTRYGADNGRGPPRRPLVENNIHKRDLHKASVLARSLARSLLGMNNFRGSGRGFCDVARANVKMFDCGAARCENQYAS